MSKPKNSIENKAVQKKMSCGLYLRVSTDMQANVKEGSLDTQLSALTKYTEIKTLNTDEEWVVSQVYREEGKSGKNTDRPEYQRMLKDIKKGRLNVLLCTKIDRVHRSLVDFYKLHELMDAYNVTFVSLSEQWDTSSPMGRFGLKLTLAVAELEREQTSQRTREKMRWRSEEGLWNGGQVLGYDIDPDEKGVLKVNAKEAKLVHLIFQTYIELRSYRETAKAINKLGYRTKFYQSRRGHARGNKKFNKSSIILCLKNPVYLGKVVHKGDLFDARHDAIISEQLWEEAATIMKTNKVSRKKPREQKMHTFLLEGLVRCGWCGNFMTPTYSGGRSNTYFYYQCTGNNKGADECQMKRVSAEALEDVIYRRLVAMSQDKKLLADIIQEANTMSQKQVKELEAHKKDQNKILADLDQGIKNIVQFIKDGKATPTMSKELEDLESQKKELLDELERIDMEFQECKTRVLNAESIRDGLNLFRDMWEFAEPKKKKDLFDIFIHRIIWTPEKIKLGLYTRPVAEMDVKSTAIKQEGVIAVDRIDWRPGLATHCETEHWWQEFAIHQEIRNRRQFIGIGAPPTKPQRIIKTPLLEALRYQSLLDNPNIRTKTDISRELGVSTARVSQVMGLLKLEPGIQDELLNLQDQKTIRFFSEKKLRPLLKIPSPDHQVKEFMKMKKLVLSI